MVKTVWMTYLNISLKLYSTHTAIAFDTDANRKLEFKAYLFTAIVPVTTVATGLGYSQEDPDFTSGSTDDKCHNIIMSIIHKIEFIQSLNRDDDLRLLVLTHRFANQKLQKIKHNLLTYHHMTDLYLKWSMTVKCIVW